MKIKLITSFLQSLLSEKIKKFFKKDFLIHMAYKGRLIILGSSSEVIKIFVPSYLTQTLYIKLIRDYHIKQVDV